MQLRLKDKTVVRFHQNSEANEVNISKFRTLPLSRARIETSFVFVHAVFSLRLIIYFVSVYSSYLSFQLRKRKWNDKSKKRNRECLIVSYFYFSQFLKMCYTKTLDFHQVCFKII